MTIQIFLAQLNFFVGDIEGNANRIIQSIEKITEKNTSGSIIVFPELAITGYPPEDLLLHPELYVRIEAALKKIQTKVQENYVILGYPRCSEPIQSANDTPSAHNNIYNSAAVLHQGKIIAVADKHYLPNYGVFDEHRYFTAGEKKACVFEAFGKKFGLVICEDLWHAGPIQHCKTAGAEYIFCINASPFHIGKNKEREKILRTRAKENKLNIAYVNLVGGQDELVFDGNSMVVDKTGEIIHCAKSFEEDVLSFELNAKKIVAAEKNISKEAQIYQALTLSVNDYIRKNHFPGAVIGLSGGIDSALTLAIATDALGADQVTAVLMPSEFTAKMSVEDAEAEAARLGVQTKIIPIDALLKSYVATLSNPKNALQAITLQNLQARIRGMILLALSNETGKIVLTTSNKSELAVGYTTIYGDMAGGFCVLKDVLKTEVYALAHYRNAISPVIPERVITRAPSAELALNQTDQDSLPPYDVLDRFLQRYIEDRADPATLITKDFPKASVEKILLLIQKSEYKRKQAPLGPRISRCGFGKDWRFPVTKK